MLYIALWFEKKKWQKIKIFVKKMLQIMNVKWNCDNYDYNEMKERGIYIGINIYKLRYLNKLNEIWVHENAHYLARKMSVQNIHN